MVNITDEELFKLVDEALKDKKAPVPTKRTPRKTRYTVQVARFIKDMGVAEGTKRYPLFFIYHVYYEKWEEYNKGHKCLPQELGRQLSKYFPKCRSGMYRYYLLNDFHEMTFKQRKEVKNWYDDHVKKRKKMGSRRASASKRKAKQTVKD